MHAIARIFAGASTLALCVAGVGAITNGEIDTGNRYPNVGMIILQNPAGDSLRWCSGSLLEERVVLTAAHCTMPLEGLLGTWEIYVSFDVDPFAVPGSWLRVSRIVTHPRWDGHFSAESLDYGALVLEQPYTGAAPLTLPPRIGYLDDLWSNGLLTHGDDATEFTRIGYGLIESWPPPALLPNTVRRVTTGRFSGVMKTWLALHGNPEQDAGTSCFFDSGSPVLYVDQQGNQYIVAVASWIDAVCRTMSLNYRTDLEDVQDFLAGVVASAD